MRKRHLAVIVAVVLVLTNGAWATTVVYVASSCGMAVGADGKTVPDGTAVKIALLKQRLVVADLYYESATSGGAVVYDFPTWIKQIDNSTDADISLSGLVEVIKKQMTSTFSFASEAIKNGKLTKEKAQVWGAGEYLVQYVIAGYENGVPLVYSLTLMPNWEAKTVNGPLQVVLKNVEPKNGRFELGWRGRGTGLKLISTANTEPQREFNALIKAELALTHSGHCLTSEHLSNVARAMLAIETEYDPLQVGYPLTVIALPKNGDGTVTTYDGNSPTLVTLVREETKAGNESPLPKPALPAVFILSNGERIESSKYVLTVDSLQVEQSGRQRTIPMSTVDLNATLAANRERGIDLQIPTGKSQIMVSF
jgi:hypothetical protein